MHARSLVTRSASTGSQPKSQLSCRDGASAQLEGEGTLAYQSNDPRVSSFVSSHPTIRSPGEVLAVPEMAMSLAELSSTYTTTGRCWITRSQQERDNMIARSSSSKITVFFGGTLAPQARLHQRPLSKRTAPLPRGQPGLHQVFLFRRPTPD